MTAVAQLLDVLGALVNTASPPTLYDSNSGVLPKGYRFPQSSTQPIVLKARAEFWRLDCDAQAVVVLVRWQHDRKRDVER
jgi:hypothetical protein